MPLPLPPVFFPGTKQNQDFVDAWSRAIDSVSDAVKDAADSISKSIEECKCPPCETVTGRIVPVGTIAYRPLDVIPDNVKQHGVYGSHHNLFKANQMPYPKCHCFWQKLKNVAKPDELQPTWIPIEPFAN